MVGLCSIAHPRSIVDVPVGIGRAVLFCRPDRERKAFALFCFWFAKALLCFAFGLLKLCFPFAFTFLIGWHKSFGLSSLERSLNCFVLSNCSTLMCVLIRRLDFLRQFLSHRRMKPVCAEHVKVCRRQQIAEDLCGERESPLNSRN
jgi:hypothetical protein